jgi:hypothetical protein
MSSTDRPLQATAWKRFQEINLPVAVVGEKIGGKVGLNIANGIFANACPIRISYMLNYSGFRIARPIAGYSAVSGADRKWYLFRVREMMDYLAATFGEADVTISDPAPVDLLGMQGIMVVRGSGWSDASGHVTLWDGTVCPDHCHLLGDPANGSFTPEIAKLWLLP